MRAPFSVLVVACLLFVGCGSNTEVPVAPTGGSLAIRVQWPEDNRLVPAASSSIGVVLERGGEIVAQTTIAKPATSAVLSSLPVGALLLRAGAYPSKDATGTAQAAGTTTVTIADGATTDARLALSSTITDFSISPNPVEVLVGESTELVATARDNAGNVVLIPNPSSATWSVISGSQYVGLSASRAVSSFAVAANGKAAGTAEVKAMLDEGGGVVRQATAVIGVQAEESVSVTIAPVSVALQTGGTQQFQAEVTGTNDSGLTWGVLEPTGGSVSASGFYTAPDAAGTFHVVATSSAHSSRSASATVTVREPAAGLSTSAWPKFRGDLRNTGRGLGSGASGTVRWQTNVAQTQQLVSSPVVGTNGLLYVAVTIGTTQGKVVALDASSGTQRWEYSTTKNQDASPAIAADGTVFVVTGNAANGGALVALVALDGETGTQKWSFTPAGWYIPYGARSSPTVSYSGIVYFGAYDGKVYAVDGQTGSEAWSFDTRSAIGSSPAITGDGTVFIGSTRLYALNGDSGAKIWEYPMSDILTAPAVADDGTVYATASRDADLYAIDPSSGARKWTVRLGGQLWSSPAVAGDGTIYIGCDDHRVYALAGSDGSVKWQTLTGGAVRSSPALGSDGTIYVGSEDGKVYALAPADGQVIWSMDAGAAVDSSPAIGSDGTVYVCNTDGLVFALN